MEWKDKIASFRQIDVRGIHGNFFQGLKKQAMQVPAGSGIEVVQSFDPIPLYEVMEGLGYEHFTEQNGAVEFHAYFYRREVKQEEKDIRPSRIWKSRARNEVRSARCLRKSLVKRIRT